MKGKRKGESDVMTCLVVCVCGLIGWFGSDNKIGDEGGVSLGKALETNSTLTILILCSEYDMSVYVCYVLCVWIGRFVWLGVLSPTCWMFSFVALWFGWFVCVYV